MRASLRLLGASLLICSQLAVAGNSEQNWFLAAAVGYESHDTSLDEDQGSIDLLFEPQDNGSTLVASAGYFLNESWFTVLEYSKFDADDTEIDNLLVSLNHQWLISDRWAVYLGALAGASTLDWQDEPIQTLRRNRESDSFVWGVQSGVTLKLGRNWQLDARYQFLGLQHDTRLQQSSGRGTFKHEQFNHLSVGIRVRF